MEDLVNIVNQLQEVFNVSGYNNVDLPQVVVLGSQSSGKSSVLEHLVGKSFLPRGTGIVTRCPLVLQLTRSQAEEYAVFQHDYTKIFTDYSLICQEIDQQTERLAGANKGICSTSIIINLFSPSHLDLTLVDLPGLTKVPVGDQPDDIDEQTRELAMEYINNPNSIILVIIPANADMTTSESLKLARDVDPEGLRTLAVVTKLDIMDAGTNAMDMLNGKVIPVKLGIIGVVNRSQKDIMEGKTVKDSLIDEAAFFKKKYETIASQHGTVYLKKTVQQILINHIKRCLPDLKDNISNQLATRRSELSLMGESKFDKPALMLDLITKFSRNFCSTIKGDVNNIETTELIGGARINYVFQETLFKALKSIDALNDLKKNAILTAIKNAAGANTALFVPQVAFELLVKRQLRNLRGPCLICVDLVYQELDKIRQSCIQDKELGLTRFPNLHEEISNVVSELLICRIHVTNDMVNHFIDGQLGYINTGHSDFVPNKLLNLSIASNKKKKNKDSEIRSAANNSNEMQPPLTNKVNDIHYTQSTPMASSDKDKSQTATENKHNKDYILVKNLIKNYFNIVRKSVQDNVPKIIMHFMVNYIMNHIHSQLIAKLCSLDSVAADLLKESPEVIAERARLESAIKTLENAENVLKSLRSSQKEVN